MGFGYTRLAREYQMAQAVEDERREKEKAEAHFLEFAPKFEIKNEIEFVLSEIQRLRQQYPLIQIAPLMYRVEDNLLYLIKET